LLGRHVGRGPQEHTCCVADMLIVGEFERLMATVSFSNAFASPKSSTFAFPSAVIMTFAGLRSR
jgi:hypothetical protein